MSEEKRDSNYAQEAAIRAAAHQSSNCGTGSGQGWLQGLLQLPYSLPQHGVGREMMLVRKLASC